MNCRVLGYLFLNVGCKRFRNHGYVTGHMVYEKAQGNERNVLSRYKHHVYLPSDTIVFRDYIQCCIPGKARAQCSL